MSTAQKLGTLLIGVALATTLTLKDRQTVPIIGALDRLGRGLLGTAMGTARPA